MTIYSPSSDVRGILIKIQIDIGFLDSKSWFYLEKEKQEIWTESLKQG